MCPFVASLHHMVRDAQMHVDQVPVEGQELDLPGMEPEVPHLDRAEDPEFPRSYYRCFRPSLAQVDGRVAR